MQFKKTIILSAFLLTAIPSLSSAALDIGNTSAGGKISSTCEVNTTDPDFEFQPSTNVNIAAASTVSSFSIIAWHGSSLDTDKGEAYGMASDVTGVYTLPLVDVTDDPTNAGAGDSSDFGTDWYDPSGDQVTAAAD